MKSTGALISLAGLLGWTALAGDFDARTHASGGAADRQPLTELFRMKNLIAWCIVPFDARARGPEERAQMLKRLGFAKFAYDWRDKDIPSFDAELEALNRHGIELTAFWFPISLQPERDRNAATILEFLRRRKVKTQLWLSLNVPDIVGSQEQKLAAAAAAVRWVAEQAAPLGCKVGLYNHGGWFGEPEHQLAVVERLQLDHVGLVYNLHHGHDQLARLPELLRRIRPHLLSLNLNGMVKGGDRAGKKIVPLGAGDDDAALLRAIRDSGVRGPFGILGHREELDAEVALKLNLDGLAALLRH